MTTKKQLQIKNKIAKRKILLCGSYHGNNYGDLAILETFCNQLESSSELTVLTTNESKVREKLDITKKVKFVSPKKIFALLRAIINSDEVIIGGGGLFHDYGIWDTIRISGKSQLLVWIIISVIAKIFRKNVYWLAVGLSPFTFIGRILMKSGIRFVDNIQVRDISSLRFMQEVLKENRVQKSADIVYLRKSAEEVGRGFAKNKFEGVNILLIFKNKKGIRSDLERLVEDIQNNYKDSKITFLSTNYDKDNELHSELALKYSLNFIDSSKFTLDQFYKVFRKFDLVISMRMHALLLGFQEGVLGIGISSEADENIGEGYLNKVEQMQEELYSEIISIRDFDSGKLKKWMDYVFANRKKLIETGVKNYSNLAELSRNNLKPIDG